MAEKRTGVRAKPVHRAMRAERPEKGAVRKLWLQVIKEYDHAFPGGEELLYVTLPGSEGHDIQMLVEAEIIKVTESGLIAEDSMLRVAAVESNMMAIGNLQKTYPGLKIYETNFSSIINGERLTRYPLGDHERCCRARIINLDLNTILRPHTNDRSVFPILAWIQKLGEIHASAPRAEWCLCLTLHGEVRWSRDVSNDVRDYLRENFQKAQKFAEAARKTIGDDLFKKILSSDELDFSTLSRELQQKILMIFVPKKIASLVQTQNWLIETRANFRYGQEGHAPMVTWVLNFKHAPRAAATPDAVYIASVDGILDVAGCLDGDGTPVMNDYVNE